MSDQHVTDHLANERTFLAWIRTGIAVMAFGFVVVKFSLFLRQIALVLNKNIEVNQHGYSSVMGIALVAFGVLINVLAYVRYRRVAQQLTDDNFKHNSILVTVLMASIFLAGIVLVVYLVHSI